MVIACPDCGLVQCIPPLSERAVAACRKCGCVLEATAGRNITYALALSLSVLALLIAGNLLPFLSVEFAGMQRETRLAAALPLLLQSEWIILAAGIAAFVLVLPIARFALLTITLGAVRFGFRPRWVGRAFRWALALELWAMADVMLLGAVIGYTRLASELRTEIGVGGWCFAAGALLSIIARASLNRRAVWQAIRADPATAPEGDLLSCPACNHVDTAKKEGQACPRCSATLRTRKPGAMAAAVAFTLAGFMLYPPSLIYPMTLVSRLGQTEGQTIFFGVKELFRVGLWPFGVVVFFTSIMIPGLKLLGISWFALAAHRQWRAGLRLRTRLHRIIENLGRWSNVDVTIIISFAPLMQFGQFASARPAVGATCFFSVVVVTMLASHFFDPRLMWDAAERKE